MPPHEQMLREILPRSIDRLDGYVDVYDPAFSLYYDVFGAPCYSFLREDATAANFEAVFDAVMSQAGGDVETAVNILAGGLDLWGCGICWDGAAIYYSSQNFPQAHRLSDLSSRLSSYGGQAGDEYLDLLEALYDNGGDTEVADPYLSRMRSALDEVVALEDSVRIELVDLLGSLTDVETGEVSGRLPAEAALASYPNPFNDRTVIRFRLEADGPVRLTVYNILGQRVRLLAGGHQRAGDHRIAWDGRDDRGAQAAGGLYLCHLETEGRAWTTKLVLLR
jgi:hypothetical protein